MVKLLLDRGADAGKLDSDGNTPSHLAVFNIARLDGQCSDKVPTMDGGCDNVDNKSNHSVESGEARDTLNLLLHARDSGANPRALDGSGRSVLFAAVATGSETTVRMVMDFMRSDGSDQSDQSDQNNIPDGTHANPTSERDNGLVCHPGIQATLNEPDKMGVLPLHLAVAFRSASMVLLLLSNGADVNG